MDFLDLFERDPALRAQYITGRDVHGRQVPLVPAGWGDFSFAGLGLDEANQQRRRSGSSGGQASRRGNASSLSAGRSIAARGSQHVGLIATTSCSPSAAASIGIETVLIHPFSTKQPEECAICLQPLLPNTQAAKMPCGEKHIFHHECLMEWLQRKPTCPLCREIPPETEPETISAGSSSHLRRPEHQDLLDTDIELVAELARLERQMQEEIAAVSDRASLRHGGALSTLDTSSSFRQHRSQSATSHVASRSSGFQQAGRERSHVRPLRR